MASPCASENVTGSGKRLRLRGYDRIETLKVDRP